MKKTILLLVIVFACRFPGAASASDPVDACSVVTHDEVEQATGVSMSGGRLTEFEAPFMRGTTVCHFDSLERKHFKRYVNIELTVADTENEALIKYRDAVSLIHSPAVIKGFGEEAVWGVDLSRPKGGLNVHQGRYYLEIKVNREDEKKNLEQSEKLAEKILKRLQ